MEHRPYPRTYRAASGPAAAVRWVATEKVHGANLVVATDGRDVRVGKRKAWLRDDEPFFGWQLLRPALARAALDLWRDLGEPTLVRLHGELYGGAYPPAAVVAVPGNSLVQTGVWYAPDVRFSLFDVQVDGAEAEPSFLAHRELEALAARHGLEAVPALGRGARGELESLPVRFATRVPARLGLPLLPDNVAEGYVLKPDARGPASTRPAVKRKIPEFDDARFDDGAAWDPDVRLSAGELQARSASLMNAARVASARSKVGPDNPVALCDEAALDALVDLEAALPRAMGALDEAAMEGPRAALVEQARAWLTVGRTPPPPRRGRRRACPTPRASRLPLEAVDARGGVAGAGGVAGPSCGRDGAADDAAGSAIGAAVAPAVAAAGVVGAVAGDATTPPGRCPSRRSPSSRAPALPSRHGRSRRPESRPGPPGRRRRRARRASTRARSLPRGRSRRRPAWTARPPSGRRRGFGISTGHIPGTRLLVFTENPFTATHVSRRRRELRVWPLESSLGVCWRRQRDCEEDGQIVAARPAPVPPSCARVDQAFCVGFVDPEGSEQFVCAPTPVACAIARRDMIAANAQPGRRGPLSFSRITACGPVGPSGGR